MAVGGETLVKVSAARILRFTGLAGVLVLTGRSLRFESAFFDTGFPFGKLWHYDLDLPLADITNVAPRRHLSTFAAALLNVWMLVPAFRRLVQSNLEVRTASSVYRFAVRDPESWVQALAPPR